MIETLPAKLGLIYFVSEVILRFSRRSGASAQKNDRGSLLTVWVSILVGIGLAILCSERVPAAAFPLSAVGRAIVVAIFTGALVLRWWSIISLGKFFTVDVAIAVDHQLIVRGPYRIIRHPSYTGALLAFAALATTLQNWVSLAAVLIPISIALAYRISVEEAALRAAFGEQYLEYSRRTKRLIPGLL